MSRSLLRCIGLIGLLGGIAIIVGMVFKNDYIELGGVVVCLAASFWLAFLAKPESDRFRDDARDANKIP